MATTPPLQIASTPETPLTPLHGATYDREFFGAARRSTRTSSRIASKASRQIPSAEASPRELQGEASVTTPRSTRRRTSRPSSGLHSPQVTPENKAARRVQVISPSSPDVQASRSKPPPPSKSHLQPLASSSTTISDGMLPTPVKTPKKKLIPKASTAARALFQDSTQNTTSVIGGDPSPRRNRKNKRYNGFSLESFSAGDEDGRDQIQIFTDSRDMVPQADKTKTNPFLEHHVNGETSSTKKVAGTTKRRKISGERKLDPQVEEAIRQDEGMVYVLYVTIVPDPNLTEMLTSPAAAKRCTDVSMMMTMKRKRLTPTTWVSWRTPPEAPIPGLSNPSRDDPSSLSDYFRAKPKKERGSWRRTRRL